MVAKAVSPDEVRMLQYRTMTSSEEDSYFCKWNISIPKKKSLKCGWSFKFEPKNQLDELKWITTGFCLVVLWSPDCQSATGRPFSPQRAAGSHGRLKTNTHVLRDSSSSVLARTWGQSANHKSSKKPHN